MNKKELAAQIAANTDLKPENAAKYLNAALEAVAEALTNGENVTLIGFGTFSVIERVARQGRNPQTGKSMKIPAKKVVKFKAGKNLKEAVDKK